MVISGIFLVIQLSYDVINIPYYLTTIYMNSLHSLFIYDYIHFFLSFLLVFKILRIRILSLNTDKIFSYKLKFLIKNNNILSFCILTLSF